MGLPPVGDNPIIAIGHPRFVAPYRMLTRYRRGGCGAQLLTDCAVAIHLFSSASALPESTDSSAMA